MAVFRKLKDGIGDLSQLQVQTFTGDLTAFIDDGPEFDDVNEPKKTLIKWQDLLKEAKNKGEVSLVAATKVNIDGDTELFISDTASSTILDAHKQGRYRSPTGSTWPAGRIQGCSRHRLKRWNSA